MAGKTLLCVVCILYIGCTTAIVVRNCEGNPLSISCFPGSVISIITANYGRSSGPDICPDKSIQTTSCFAPSSLSIVSNLCSGQRSCTVVATNDVFGDPCVGTYKYLEVNYTCESGPDTTTESTFGNALNSTTEPTCGDRVNCLTERTCERNSLSISCSSGSVISIVSANYGRTAGRDTCPDRNIQTTSCFAPSSLNIVSNLCSGQRSCTVVATNDVFGDPCVGTYKYLEIYYTCERGPDFPTEPTCQNGLECTSERTFEGNTLSISCTSGSVINIVSANYGRTAGSETSPHSSIQPSKCFASNSLKIVSNLCNGHKRCTVLSANSVFGDPCVGTDKYLEVKYNCDRGPDHKTNRICEGGSINLSCPPGTPAIVVTAAMYGRQVPGSDFCPHSSIKTTTCASPNSLATVQTACQGRSFCTLAASNQIFSDPCVGTYKYLEIEYTCARRSRVCEHSMLHITCPSEQKIAVLDAFYGRMAGPGICPHPRTSDQNCRASYSLLIVKEECNGLSSCTVTASNIVFGDPCVGTFKYLEVLYECEHKPT